MDFSTVLLPQPLPPMTAKMLPRRTSNDRLLLNDLRPKRQRHAAQWTIAGLTPVRVQGAAWLIVRSR